MLICYSHMKLLLFCHILCCFLRVQVDDERTIQISNRTFMDKMSDLFIADKYEILPISLISLSTFPKWNKYNSGNIKINFEFSFHFPLHMFFYLCQNPKIFALMFEHLKQLMHIFLLRIDGALPSSICARMWIHLQIYV